MAGYSDGSCRTMVILFFTRNKENNYAMWNFIQNAIFSSQGLAQVLVIKNWKNSERWKSLYNL